MTSTVRDVATQWAAPSWLVQQLGETRSIVRYEDRARLADAGLCPSACPVYGFDDPALVRDSAEGR